ncbi:putative mitochondrial protein [Tanacetum coccineum]
MNGSKIVVAPNIKPVTKVCFSTYKATTESQRKLSTDIDESPPTKLSPLVDDDVGEEEAIRNNNKVVNNNNEEDESIEVDEVANIKESKNHPLDQVIGNLNQRTLSINEFCVQALLKEIHPSPSIPEHIDHLRIVLQVMREHNLFVKQSKCVFGTTQVEYLGHVISAQGVSTDPSKIKAMQEWSVPSNLKQLRGFLGLTRYYRRFIKGYTSISQPLTMLLKKNAFQWNPKAEKAFEKLQQAMIQSPVLALPNFDEEFVIEIDASGMELLVVVLALQKWRGYLLDRHFKIRIDHFSLKYVLDQRLTTPFQSKWLPKLLGFDDEIEYKEGADNAAGDALSRIERQGVLFSMLAGTSNELMDAVIATWASDSSLQAIIKGQNFG